MNSDRPVAVGQFQSLAAGGFLPSHQAIVATIKRVPRLHDRERKLGYALIIEPALADFPSADAAAGAARLNAVMEAKALRQLHQYSWLHERF